AQRNIDLLAQTGAIDLGYLRSLGPDATPTIAAGLPADLVSCVLRDRRAPTDDLRTWNLGRARAVEVLTNLPASPDPTACGTWLASGFRR
ncbi:MAG: putative two-component system sensor kinase, partial [Humibacillus sp.]|nr:putative two-component system sensor kinase [Humibacillus sp.]